MKKITFFFILLTLTCVKSFAQKIYYTKHETDADLVVYEVKLKADTDIIVKKVRYNDEVKKGFWKEVKTRNEAELVVYITNRNTTDVKKVFFTKYNDEVKY